MTVGQMERYRYLWIDIYGMKTADRMARGRCSVMETTDSLVNIRKWSDGVQRVVVRDGAREESEEVITRSRMCREVNMLS